ncbi:MAG TPA: HDIG domain-containing protein [Candidatus Aphodocola excrementigallinarum]|uniref:HDIG domain-containing protein n=1 Tax=Candidatus Aphodocola excrementigallinarum TaxID=2840670 RepID=A0A9D1LHZ3_9FIRM|nr:HDIG domain-containing protein [Candidatus Aphodocola excrementigallinarum]
MKLTSKKAKEMLEEARKKTNDDGWINHSLCVGYAAGKIAKALNLDEEKAKTLGYIHDIGKSIKFKGHVMEGYNYLKKLGYDDEYCNVCLTHSYLNNDVNCTQGEPDNIPFRTEFIKNHKYTIYERIINLCDLMCTNKVVTMEKRLIDVISRRPQHKNIVYHVKEALKLKKYFDDLLGYNVYDLFPEIKENL